MYSSLDVQFVVLQLFFALNSDLAVAEIFNAVVQLHELLSNSQQCQPQPSSLHNNTIKSCTAAKLRTATGAVILNAA
jgi:hypothetical protein